MVLAGSSADKMVIAPPGSIVSIDISNNGPFGNPFPLGVFDSNIARRREAVALHERWLNARPAIEAADIRNFDGSSISSALLLRSGYWRSQTALDVLSAFERIVRANPDAHVFRLQCTPSCHGCLCHGSALVEDLRQFLAADRV